MPVHDLPRDVFLDTRLAPYELAFKSTCRDLRASIMDGRPHNATESDAGFYTESVAQTKYWMGYGLSPSIAFKATLRMGNIVVVKFFMSDFAPPAPFAPNVDKHHYAINRAAYYGQQELIEELLKLGCDWNACTSASAASNNQKDLMKWMHKKGCPFGYLTCSTAAKFNHLESLRFLREELKPKCPWNESTCITAAEFGRLECLQYALSNGSYVEKQEMKKMLKATAKNGHINCFDYLWEWSEFDVEDANARADFKIYSNTLDTHFDMIYWIKAAATHGQKEILLYIERKLHLFPTPYTFFKLWTNIEWYDCFKMVKNGHWFKPITGIHYPEQVDLFDYIKNEKIIKNMTEFKKYLLKQFMNSEYPQSLLCKCPKCKAVYNEPLKRGVCNMCYFDVINEFEKEFEKYLDFDEHSNFDIYPYVWDFGGFQFFSDEDSDGSENDSEEY